MRTALTGVRRGRPALAALIVSVSLASGCVSPASPSPQIPPRPLAPTGSLTDRVLRFAVIGDFGTGGDEERSVALTLQSWAAAHPLEALVTTGDNIYPSGHPERFDAAWRDPYGWIDQAGLPVVASLGNHDVQTQGGRPVMDLFSLPGHWYARRYGPVKFIVLDANRPAHDAQLRFLRRALRTSTAPWTIAVFHQPAYSCGRHGSSPAVQAAWVRLFRRGGVDLVLNGHDHDYQRFRPIGGVRYIVSGGGGARLYDVGACPAGTPRPAAAAVAHHFLYVTASATRLGVRAILAPSGQVVDRLRLLN